MQNRETQALYPIGVVEQLTGLTARQIRYYESRELLRPQRTPGRQRLYSLAEVERLKEIKELMTRGFMLEDVRAQLERRTAREAARLQARAGVDPLLTEAPPRLARDLRLTSLYPVSNRAVLMQMIEKGSKPEGR
ncbi:MAG: MerR family transcriptional regulator [Symbiobacteriia bacterium]